MLCWVWNSIKIARFSNNLTLSINQAGKVRVNWVKIVLGAQTKSNRLRIAKNKLLQQHHSIKKILSLWEPFQSSKVSKNKVALLLDRSLWMNPKTSLRFRKSNKRVDMFPLEIDFSAHRVWKYLMFPGLKNKSRVVVVWHAWENPPKDQRMVCFLPRTYGKESISLET